MPGKIKIGTNRKKSFSTEQMVKRANALFQHHSVGRTKGKTESQYIVTIDATSQGETKALWGEILQLIGIIQNFFKGKSTNTSTINNEIHNGGSSNGPNSPVVNITFVFNINNYNGKTE